MTIFRAWPVMAEILASQRLRKPRQKGRGRARVNAVLTPEEVLAIRALRERGKTPGQIVKELGLPRTQVVGVVQNENGTRSVWLKKGI